VGFGRADARGWLGRQSQIQAGRPEFFQALIAGKVLPLDFPEPVPEGFEFAPAHGPFLVNGAPLSAST